MKKVDTMIKSNKSASYNCMIALCETKYKRLNRKEHLHNGKWRQPEQQQLALEKQTANLIKRFLNSGVTDTKQPYFRVDSDEQQKLIDGIAEVLANAHSIGVLYGQVLTEKQERGLVSNVKDFLGRARDIVTGIIDRVREAISDALSKNDEGSDPEQVVQDALQNEIDVLPDLVAETEVVSAVESAVLDTLKDADIPQIIWVTNPGACEICTENEEQGPINIGSTFASGHAIPPAHPRCRCNLSTP